MVMVPEEVSGLVESLAVERGFTPAQVLALAVRQFADHPATEDDDLLEAFIGCGASGDRRERSIHELRDELSAAQLADRA